MKRELHTLYIKHDSQFKTLSKIALSQLILKIVYLKGDGTLLKQIETELSNILSSPVSRKDIEDAIRVLIKSRKLNVKSNRHFIHNDYKEELNIEVEKNKALLEKVISKYFSKAETEMKDIEDWFNDSVISFFENHSFEWFQQVSHNGRNNSNIVPNIQVILESAILNNIKIKDADKEWLKLQFIKFIESDDPDDNLLFWYYGISMFSSRLITARNYADGFTIDMFRDSKFILDTNILMILDLEEHELSTSLESLETILEDLNISPVYFRITREEYTRAMDWKKTEIVSVFENYKMHVLKTSDCPFIQTALRRGCNNSDDVRRMFEKLLDVPVHFNDSLRIETYDTNDLDDVIDAGINDSILKFKINEAFKKRTGKSKREKPLMHDAGLISGATFVRKDEKCWIITNDSIMKRFAIDNCLRDEPEVAVGLDVIIGLMAVNSGGVSTDASNFAPLFKNLIKYSLIPEGDAFDLKDLAFILRTDTKINELSSDRVIEAARTVKRMRIAGSEEEDVALYLRRFIEGETIGLTKDIEAAINNENIAKTKKEQVERENNTFANEIRRKRIGELRDQYDTELRNNKLALIFIPLIVTAIVYCTIRYGLKGESTLFQYLIGLSIEFIFGILPLFPLNKRISKKYSEYVDGINQKVENEILELRKKTK